MKCKYCGAEIPNGELKCPVCGKEVQLVHDYETVETLLTEKELKEKEEKEKQEETSKKAAEEAKKRRPKPAVVIAKLILSGLVTAGAAYLLISRIDQVNSESYIYQKHAAESAYDAGEYTKAAAYADKAASLNSNAGSVQLLKAEILAAEGKSEEAISSLQQIISADSGNTDAYEALIKIYEKDRNYDKIAETVKESGSNKLRKKYASYIVENPEFSMISGIYPSNTTLKITSDSGDIYYTTDGSDPTKKSTLYNGTPINLPEGKKTTVKAVAINEKGISSEIVTGVYTIESDAPDDPSVTPDSGTYVYGAQQITVSIPEGCTVYYLIDGTPSAGTGNIYTKPVEMPLGTHIFSAIAQDVNGHTSHVVSRTYHVT